MIDWWLAPLSGAATHAIAPWAAWHSRLMVLAWGVLVPLGVLAAVSDSTDFDINAYHLKSQLAQENEDGD